MTQLNIYHIIVWIFFLERYVCLDTMVFILRKQTEMEEFMKYGVLWHKNTSNLGDDIQAYASSKFYPHIDYAVDRENLVNFKSDDNEPVAVIMSAWWMWKKWNWPPVSCIIPKLTGMFVSSYTVDTKSSPITTEWMEGIGGDYFKAYGPVGCRDYNTINIFKERGIDNYFSGCVTLTLPKQKVTPDAGTYVCFVDLKPELEKKARELVKGTGLKIKVLSHDCKYKNSEISMEERFKIVEERLTVYQNAKFVVTRRLHCSLPCLAMGTPVLCIGNMRNSDRWYPYCDWVRTASIKEFLDGDFEFDFKNPPANREDFRETRDKMVESLNQFVADCDKLTGTTEEIKKTTYTDQEVLLWQNQVMRDTLDKWLDDSRKMLKEKTNLKNKVGKLRKELEKCGKEDPTEAKKEKKGFFGLFGK